VSSALFIVPYSRNVGDSVGERPQFRDATEALSTPSFSLMAILNEMTPHVYLDTTEEEVKDLNSTVECHMEAAN